MNKKISIKGIVQVAVPLIVSVAALIVSVRSCSIAQDAADVSRQTFVYGNRPYLILQPYKEKEKDMYVIATANAANVLIKTHFELRNEGQSPAVDIKVENTEFEIPSSVDDARLCCV